MSAKKTKKILSLDGGGIRGLVTSVILMALEEKLNKHYKLKFKKDPERPVRIGQVFDMLSGTSTGGILSCLLLTPDPDIPGYPKYSAEQAAALYIEKGAQIFTKSTPGRVPFLGSAFFGAKYARNNIEGLLDSYFGNMRISQLLKPCLITSYDIEKRRAVFFAQHDALAKGNMYDFLVKEVARSTSAAPTYFPPGKASSLDNLIYHTIDGGLFANNPTMCAVIESLKLFGDQESEELLNPGQLFVLSIGTGTIEKQYPYDKATGWGTVNWISPIIDIMMSAVSETVDYQLRKLYASIRKEDQYVRLMPNLYTADPEMDNTSPKNLEALRQAGLSNVMEFDDKLERVAEILIKDYGQSSTEVADSENE